MEHHFEVEPDRALLLGEGFEDGVRKVRRGIKRFGQGEGSGLLQKLFHRWQCLHIAPMHVQIMPGDPLSQGWQAKRHGYVEGIVLDVQGYVSEGSGENIFVVLGGKIYTPPRGNSILTGITRSFAFTLAEEKGYSVIEQQIPREMLYIADEIFFTGTAAEITPVKSVDGIEIGSGSRGPITKEIQAEFFAIITGEVEDRHGWLTPVK